MHLLNYYLDHFENLLDNVIDTDKNVILLGDLNIDLLKASPTSRISRICERYDIENVVQEPTRITSLTAALPDPIYMNNLSILRNSMILPSFCSDHCLTLIEIKFSTARQKAYSKVIFDYESGDYASANMYLQGKNWNESFKNLHNTIKIIGLIFNQEVQHVMDTYIQKRKVLVIHRDKPWITTCIKAKMRKRNRDYKKAKSRNLVSDWKKFKELRNEMIDPKKHIFKSLHNYMHDHAILTDQRSGLRIKDSTINQLLLLYDEIVKNLDKGKDVRFIFCDVSKAFDRVWHMGLLYKLRKYGTKENQKLRDDLDALEQYSRRDLLRIKGMSDSGNDETSEKTTELVTELVRSIDSNYRDGDTIRSHRIGTPRSNPGDNKNTVPRQIIVRLRDPAIIQRDGYSNGLWTFLGDLSSQARDRWLEIESRQAPKDKLITYAESEAAKKSGANGQS
ncbi:unnamed protein product [Mytilus edulis]|uniref:Reverse transcriptase domain-containing protein n=1 Tax=Mytilus edulis TaxID=6550 RepID=A0A8S3PLV7_MYTED|nr:unnamed protein product [Mytilus edulis]